MSKPGKKDKAASPQPPSESALKQTFLGWYGVVGMTLGYVSPIKLPWADGYAKDYWRHALGSLLIVLALIMSLVGLLIYMLDVNDFKAQIVDYVKTHQQRDLVLEGDIHLNYFPQLGLDTGKLSLSQRNSGRKFASVNNARLYVAWWPLLTRQVRVERIVLDGLHANLVRHPDGSTNFDDLLQPADWMGEVQFEVEQVRVLDASVNFHDEGSGTALFVHELNLESGRLADARSGQVNATMRLQSAQPQLALQLRVGGHVLYEHAQRRVQVADFEGHAQGDAGSITGLALDWRTSLTARPGQRQLTLDKFSATAKGRWEQQNFESRLSADSLKLDQGKWHGTTVGAGASLQRDKDLWSAFVELPVADMDEQSLRSDAMQLALDLFPGEGTLQGKFSGTLNHSFSTGQLQLTATQSSWQGSHPLLIGKINGSSTGSLLADFRVQEARLELKTRVDETELDSRVQLRDFRRPAWTIDLSAGTLDLDRYLVSDWLPRLQTAALALDADALKTLDLKGKLRSETLRAARLKAGELNAEWRAGAGEVAVEIQQARLYGGNLQGGATVKTGADGPQFSLRQSLSGVQLDALLADLFGGDARLHGTGNLAFDLNAQGRSPEALRQSLSGSASVALARGSIAGLNLPEGLLAGKDQLGIENAVRNDSMRLTENTPFSELKAHVDFAQGQARSNDLMLKAASYSAKGDGSYTLENGLLDAWLSTTVAPGLKRNTAGNLAELAGISVPLQVSGPWATATLGYKLDEASGGNLARLAKANQARVAVANPAPTAVATTSPNVSVITPAPGLTRTTAAASSKPVAR